MLTKRAFLLTLMGLLTGYLAEAQSAAPAAGPTPSYVLSLAVYAVGAVVLIFGVMTAVSLAAVATEAALHEEPAATPVATAAPEPTEQKVAA
ncbi:hypothetical protein LGH70_01600 [Hymenobacter sp. BT635]|uniref:CcmD family protein n=1 Tax=Hymenobacter nitidus TaxID=2880929 RepID=A0ABS8A955_9BACT|nr:hypothetical protein [Hymenobacter nitidus]MCB2376257.1 hypothetical protein [Hymenobacter nitidus]